MARFCSNCGASLKEGDKFCVGCGAAVEASAPALTDPHSGSAFASMKLPDRKVLIGGGIGLAALAVIALAYAGVVRMPWSDHGADTNGDGKIDLIEMQVEAEKFMTEKPFQAGTWKLSRKVTSKDGTAIGSDGPAGAPNREIIIQLTENESEYPDQAAALISAIADIAHGRAGRRIESEFATGQCSIPKFLSNGGKIDIQISCPKEESVGFSGTYSSTEFALVGNESDARSGNGGAQITETGARIGN